MKILLIQPPARKIEHENVVVPPLGLAYLGAVLVKNGFEVKILDAFAEQLSWADFEERVAQERADLIGIGGMSAVIDSSFRALEISRKYTQYLTMGGPHVSAYREEIFQQCPQIDFAIYGEGEATFLELARKLEEGEDLSSIRGLIRKEGINPPRELLKDLNSLPFPARQLLPNDCYRYALTPGKSVTTMFTSRGCPYQCIFCDKSVFGSRYRARCPENVVGEMEEIVSGYKINSIIIYDDLFTMQRERVKEICKGIIEKKLKIDWKCEGRVSRMEEGMLRLMKKAGCSLIAYGVESGNQKVLDYLRKKTTVEQIREAFKLTKKVGIKPVAYFILGSPVETYEEALESIEFAKRLDPTYVQFSTLSPFYGTPLYTQVVEKGWYKEVDAQNPVDKDRKRPAVITEEWSEEKLQRILKEAYGRFYGRPSYMLKRLLRVRTFSQLRDMVRAGLGIFKWYFHRIA